MSGEKSFDFDFNFKYESEKKETLERIEQQCDRMAAPPYPAYRETKEILWGFYKSEKIDCPEPQSKNEESDEDSQDNSEQDDIDD
ncbi:hypothetical protein WA1_16645 [Scytonema hofmannii PCC 7110]|uniref:Uncharacterized protein n=1 Tax=Scytonema hofmannii PCC 7110 TaxID=128403 RepID=A0A139XAF8_9CYAN|nr:hypothetical protein [Scytonema hofmannii]KYC41671.1 hypothetical protein WA1_16645 [Scytonema hofmannii PCC 7110]